MDGHAYRPDEKEQGILKVVLGSFSRDGDCKLTIVTIVTGVIQPTT